MATLYLCTKFNGEYSYETKQMQRTEIDRLLNHYKPDTNFVSAIVVDGKEVIIY